MNPSGSVPMGDSATQAAPGAAPPIALFCDAAGALRWLAGQPQANAAAMRDALVEQIAAFGALDLVAGERYAVLEALRSTVAAVASENRKRYEFRALPLLPAEYATFCAVVRLWRVCALAYQHCLHAAVAGDAAVATRAAELAQRTLSCLRMEQVACYVAGCELASDFWSRVHAAWACAEQLGCTRHAVIDRVLKETLESTPAGHYGMALLLHLARPYALSRAEFGASYRWFLRWRELTCVEDAPSDDPTSFALDEGAAQTPSQPGNGAPARCFSPRGVLRKMRQRVERLAAGQSPDSLKLGSSLSARECINLLKTLDYRLTHPLALRTDVAAHAGEACESGETGEKGDPVIVAVGLEACHRQLGGALPQSRPTQTSSQTSSFVSQLVAQQIAVFGHAVRAPDRSSERAGELWRLVAHDSGRLRLVRPAGAGDARIALRGLLMLRLPQYGDDLLATVSSVRMGADGSLRIDARRLAGQPLAVVAELRDRHAAKGERHAAIVLTPASGLGAPQLFIAAGLSPRTTPVRFFDIDGEPISGLRFDECLEHGADCERWTLAV